MITTTKLYESLICRLCAEENINGNQIYHPDESGDNLCDIINKYLPLKVKDDGKLPCTLCPGCTIQLEATRSFLDLIVDGQTKLKGLYNVELEQDKQEQENVGKEQLESALKIVNPNSSVQTYSVQSDENGEKIFIQILSDGPLFPQDHEMAVILDNTEKPKRKRGRPPKTHIKTEQNEAVEESVQVCEPEPEEEILDANGKPKRKIKKPLKYSDLIQGKELDRVFLNEGINDDEDICNNSALKLVDNGASASNNVSGIKTKRLDAKKKFDCEICGRSFLHQSRLEMHKAFHKDIFYQCSTCAQTFNGKEAFQEHSNATEHTDFKLIEYVENYGQVELPPNVENDIDAIKTAETTNNEKIKCDFCEKLFSSKQSLEIHQKAVHENEKPYACDKCDKEFPYLYSYKNHILQHSEKSYQCEICNKLFQHPSSLVYHRETEHNNGRKFVCNKCKKIFKHKQLLLRHQLVHTSERPFNCTNCSSSFKTRANLINHMSTHTKEKKFFCTECGLSFGYKTSLNLHQRWHNGQKPYECDVCLKRFSQKGNLAEHRRIHTGEKPFCCSYCGRRFTTSSQYKLHVKRHTGERPWRCEYCSKTFLHKDTWKCHTRRHRNERPYQCSHCLRGFTEQWALKKHERLHTGEKPYTCNVCSKSFADSSNLKKHTKIHLKNQIEPIKKESIETSENGQVLYFTYEDDTTQNQQALVQIVENMNENEGSSANNTLFTDEMIQDGTTEEISIDVQQLVDNDGNAISLTTDDGQQIKVVTTMYDTQCMQGLFPDGTLIPLNICTQDGKPVAELVQNTQVERSIVSDLRSMDLIQPAGPIEEKEGKIQFLNEDGQNLCFITTYDTNQFIMN